MTLRLTTHIETLLEKSDKSQLQNQRRFYLYVFYFILPLKMF